MSHEMGKPGPGGPLVPRPRLCPAPTRAPPVPLPPLLFSAIALSYPLSHHLTAWPLHTTMYDLAPELVLLLIFAVLLLKHTVAAFGKASIQNAAWNAYARIAPRFGHKKLLHLEAKRTELLAVNKERRSISAQDHYAKWTKLNRQYDKLQAEVALLSDELAKNRSQVFGLVSTAIMLLTTAPIWFSRFWFRKVVLFHLPLNVFPYVVERILALPFVVTGGVGLTVWMFAVNSVLSSLTSIISFAFAPAVAETVQ